MKISSFNNWIIPLNPFKRGEMQTRRAINSLLHPSLGAQKVISVCSRWDNRELQEFFSQRGASPADRYRCDPCARGSFSRAHPQEQQPRCPLQSIPTRQLAGGPRKRWCTPLRTRRNQGPIRARLAAIMRPFAAAQSLEKVRRTLCVISKTLLWSGYFSQRASLHWERGGFAGRELQLQRPFVPADHKSSLISIPRCGISSAQHTPRDEFGCLNAGIDRKSVV